ncbi:glycosyltransferase, partial [Shewanella sp. Bg11-22]
MKKILYLVSTLKRCGPTNQLSYIIKYLDKSRYTPIVLTLSEELENDSIKSHFTDGLGVRVETLNLSRIAGVFFAKSSLNKFIRENKIDLVHSQGLRADSLVGSLKIPKVATLRNYPFYDYPMTYGKIKGNLMAKFHLNSLKKVDEP